MHRVDLEVAPIERPIGVVMIDLAGAARVFGALHRQRDAAGRSEFVAGVLLVRRQPPARLIGLGSTRFLRRSPRRDHQGPLESDAEW